MRSITIDEYKAIMEAMENGSGGRCTESGASYRANPRVALALRVQATTGLRIGDVLSLRLSNFVKEGGRYHFTGLREQKTGKERAFPVPFEVVDALRDYAEQNNIGKDSPLFPLTVRGVQKYLKTITEDLCLDDVSTHSFRKLFATLQYENSGHNIELVRRLLQHSSARTTQKYLGVTEDEIEQALLNHNLM